MSWFGSLFRAGAPTSIGQAVGGMQPQDVNKNFKHEEEKRKSLLVSPVIKAKTPTATDSAALPASKTTLGS